LIALNNICAILLLILLTSCASAGAKSVRCANGKGVKTKTFKSAQKKSKRSVSTSRTASAAPSKNQPIEEAKREEKKPPILEFKERDLKIEEDAVTFRGERYEDDADIEFDETIDFEANSNILTSEIRSSKKLEDLIVLMQAKDDYEITITGNAGGDHKEDIPYIEQDTVFGTTKILYGNSAEVHNQSIPIADRENGGFKYVTVGDVMLMRADRVRDILIAAGISGARIKTQKGTYHSQPKRFVSFTIEKP